jgi:hypothetical protein
MIRHLSIAVAVKRASTALDALSSWGAGIMGQAADGSMAGGVDA